MTRDQERKLDDRVLRATTVIRNSPEVKKKLSAAAASEAAALKKEFEKR